MPYTVEKIESGTPVFRVTSADSDSDGNSNKNFIVKLAVTDKHKRQLSDERRVLARLSARKDATDYIVFPVNGDTSRPWPLIASITEPDDRSTSKTGDQSAVSESDQSDGGGQQEQNELRKLRFLQGSKEGNIYFDPKDAILFPFITGSCDLHDYCQESSFAGLDKEAKKIFIFNAMQQIYNALRFVHGKGIAHNDVKPENALVINPQQVKLIDFGIAKRIDSRLSPRDGTISSASPEFLLKVFGVQLPDEYETYLQERKTDESDLWSLFLFFALLSDTTYTGCLQSKKNLNQAVGLHDILSYLYCEFQILGIFFIKERSSDIEGGFLNGLTKIYNTWFYEMNLLIKAHNENMAIKPKQATAPAALSALPELSICRSRPGCNKVVLRPELMDPEGMSMCVRW